MSKPSICHKAKVVMVVAAVLMLALVSFGGVVTGSVVVGFVVAAQVPFYVATWIYIARSSAL